MSAHQSARYKAEAAALKREQRPLCERCRGWIRYDLAWPHPQSFSAGHQPGYELWQTGGVHVDGSLRPEHLGCNTAAGAAVTNARRRGVLRLPDPGPSRAW